MRWTAGVAACALAAVTLSACTGSTGSVASADLGSAGGRADAGVARAAPTAPSAVPSGTANAGGVATGGTTSGTAATDVSASHLDPQLILTGSLSVVVRSVGRSAARAESIAAGVGGRTDADDQDSPRGSRPTAELTLRVPNGSVPSVLDKLAALGRQTDRHLSTRDVTTQIADVASRVTSARAAIRSLRSLYAKATKIGDVISIESSLSQREAALESLEARQRSLSRQVALATITLELSERKAPAPPPAARKAQPGGFVGGLHRGWHAFTAVVSGLALTLGAVLPFLLVLAVLALVAVGVRRRLRPRTTTAAADE